MKRILNIFLCLIMFSFFCISAKATENEDLIINNEYSIAFDVTYVWEDCYAATITIDNLSEQTIENWQLNFYLNNNIIRIENAQKLEQIGNKYTIVPKSYSKVISSGGLIQIGIVVSGISDVIPYEFELFSTYQTSKSVDFTILEKSKVQDKGEFYIIQDDVTSLSGTFNDIKNISDANYIIEDEFGNILTSGNVTFDDSWKIKDIGFGIGYNRVTITGMSYDNPISCSFEIVNFNLANTKRIGIDIETDTDDDGVSDYLENYIGTDYRNPCSISEEKSDYTSIVETIGLNFTENEDKYYYNSEDKDIFQGSDISNQLANNIIVNLTIHRTSHPEGTKESNNASIKYVADDLTFNDYSYKQLCEKGSIFAVANVTRESLMWSEMAAIFAVAKSSDSSINAVLDELIDTFRNGNSKNKGTTVKIGDSYSSSKYVKYNNSTLTRTVAADSTTINYINLIKSYVVNYLCNTRKPYELKYTPGGSNNKIENYVYGFDKTPYPSYDGTTALAIAIHGWHGHTITLQDYRETSTGFTGTLKFHFYDHFGLDGDDEINHVGFCDWFTLQHYTRFNGLYSPFLTYCDISAPISGTFR